MNILEYKNYFSKIEFSAEDKVLYGKIEGIKDLVNFESDTIDGIEKEFHAAVDDYLELCAELGQAPDKAYSGTFNVRVSPQLHRKIAIAALKTGETLNATVSKALTSYFENSTAQQIEKIWKSISESNSKFKNESSATITVYGDRYAYNQSLVGAFSHD
ncbi:MAG: type II toxin-antitoxin system HicB family antitoxin [Clostridia bacterium]|nr:type II toxin-antitoxin system HicB family antitoxin [Clostridia bacterium]